MEDVRFFVGNLNPATKEEDLNKLFQDYGKVKNIEFKFKDTDVKNEKIIAFVNLLHISRTDAEYFASELSCRKLNGSKLKVALAKESFLDRLKREREEVATSSTKTSHNAPTTSEQINFFQENLKNTRKKFSDDFDEDYQIESELLMKKRASNSLQSGRIFIQNFDTTPVHIIKSKNSKQMKTKSKDAETSTAEQKRKESVLKMQNEYQQKKSMIQKSLTNLDSVASNKIIFSNDEENEKDSANNTKSKINIFNSDDDNGDDQTDDIEFLTNFAELGKKKSEKLIQLQSRQSLDPRFKIDAKFVDDVDDNDDENMKDVTDDQNADNERDWQLNILEEVVGTKIDKRNVLQKATATKNRKMLHFDPVNEEHNKMLLLNQTEELNKNAKQYTNKKQNQINEDNIDQLKQQQQQRQNSISENIETQTSETTFKVSQDVFYKVNDTLADILKAPSDGFSLLNMLGKVDEMEKHEKQLKRVSNQGITISNKMERNVILNPFGFNDEIEDAIDNELNENEKETKSTIISNKKQKKMLLETFFMYKKDERLKEGANFFLFEKDVHLDEDYENVRCRLKKLIKTKIVKSRNKRAALGGATKKKTMKKY